MNTLSRIMSRYLMAIIMLFSLSVDAETIKVFTLMMGEKNYTSATDKSAPAQFLNDNNVDFGYFMGPKATTYFPFTTDPNYTIDNKVVLSWNSGIHVYAWRTSKYEFVARYNPVSIGSNGKADACVLRNKFSGALYAMISFGESSNTITANVGNFIKTITNDYPTAVVVAGLTKKWAAPYATVEGYLKDTWGFNGSRCSENCGGIYFSSNMTITDYSQQEITVGTTAVEPAALATVTFPSKFRVLFQDWDGTELQNTLVAENGSVTPPADPVRQGYEFTGWDHDASEFACVTNHITTTAQYKLLDTNYNVTFNDWDDSLISQVSVPKNTPVARPADPVRKYYDFRAWKNGDADWNFEDPVASNMTLKADYSLRPEYEVGDAAALTEILAAGLPSSIVIRLINDIDFASVAYTPGDFSATLDGNGHKITGLANNAHLFNTLYGTVKNLTIADVGNMTSIGESSGILALTAEGATVADCTIENCQRQHSKSGCWAGLFFHTVTKNADDQRSLLTNCVARNSRVVTASTSSSQRFGGIAADVSNADIIDCHFVTTNAVDVSVGGTVAYAGGIAGQIGSNTRVERCSVSGRVSALESVNYVRGGVGGIAGAFAESCLNVIVNACTNEAAVAGHQGNGAGGIVGRTFKGKTSVIGSVNRGAVSATYGTGDWNSNGAGGILGSSMGSSMTYIADCANYGSVEANGSGAAGGIFGNVKNDGETFLQMTNSFNYGSVGSEVSAGGLVGAYFGATGESRILNSGNAGTVRCATNAAGGIVGSAQYYNNNVILRLGGLLQVGQVVTESGYASLVVGLQTGSNGSNLSLPLESCVLAGSATATAGGQIGSIIGGFTGSGKTIVPTPDADCRLLGTYAATYYDNENQPQTLDITAMTAADLRSKNGSVKILNDNATAKGYALWVRAKNHPELALFGTECRPGMILFYR